MRTVLALYVVWIVLDIRMLFLAKLARQRGVELTEPAKLNGRALSLSTSEEVGSTPTAGFTRRLTGVNM